MSEREHGATVHDVVAIGFGPSNLALAVALEEQAVSLDAVFLERKPCFSWQDGMLLAEAWMQVSFLKDLATLRDPGSRFTFLQFLKAQRRLDQFINLGTLRPTRVEFNAYLTWAAEQVRARVCYRQNVVSVEPVVTECRDGIRTLRVRTHDPQTDLTDEHLTRNLVLGAGAEAHLPDGVALNGSRHVCHASDFLGHLRRHFSDHAAKLRFVVVGDGQSSAEIFDYLDTSYSSSVVTAVTRGIGYRPMDESPFVNEIFFPDWIDVFQALSRDKRDTLLSLLRNTNYAAVNPMLIERIYRRIYEAKAMGSSRLQIRPFADLRKAAECPDGVGLEFEDWLTGRVIRIEADVAVFATGYAVPNPHPLLAGLTPYLETDETGSYDVRRDYRVATKQGFTPGVFLQGYAEGTHGISDTLLSVACVRAREIAESLEALMAWERRQA